MSVVASSAADEWIGHALARDARGAAKRGSRIPGQRRKSRSKAGGGGGGGVGGGGGGGGGGGSGVAGGSSWSSAPERQTSLWAPGSQPQSYASGANYYAADGGLGSHASMYGSILSSMPLRASSFMSTTERFSSHLGGMHGTGGGGSSAAGPGVGPGSYEQPRGLRIHGGHVGSAVFAEPKPPRRGRALVMQAAHPLAVRVDQEGNALSGRGGGGGGRGGGAGGGTSAMVGPDTYRVPAHMQIGGTAARGGTGGHISKAPRFTDTTGSPRGYAPLPGEGTGHIYNPGDALGTASGGGGGGGRGGGSSRAGTGAGAGGAGGAGAGSSSLVKAVVARDPLRAARGVLDSTAPRFMSAQSMLSNTFGQPRLRMATGAHLGPGTYDPHPKGLTLAERTAPPAAATAVAVAASTTAAA
eukprot:g341.t1